MEGVGGVSTWDVQASAKGREYEQFRRLMTIVAVEKLVHSGTCKNWIASGSSTNDFSRSPRHFLSSNFRLCSEKSTFSTATPVRDTYPDSLIFDFSCCARADAQLVWLR